MKLKVKTNVNNYSVIVGKDLCSKIDKIILSERINSQKFLLVYDSKVPSQKIRSIINSFKKGRIEKKKIVFNEKSKNLETVSSILKILEKKNFSRNDCLISVGGGICGDVSGFASSIFKRGLYFVNVPTTLLSQVDSSIGGKTGINSLSGKNMIGSFYQPSLVISDISFLKSLPKKEMICGYAEILKHSLIRNKIFFKFLEKNYNKKLNKQPHYREDANNQILGKLYVKNGLYLGESNASNTPATLLSRDSLLKLEGTDSNTNNVGNKAVMTTSDGQVKIDTLHINQHFEIAA